MKAAAKKRRRGDVLLMESMSSETEREPGDETIYFVETTDT